MFGICYVFLILQVIALIANTTHRQMLNKNYCIICSNYILELILLYRFLLTLSLTAQTPAGYRLDYWRSFYRSDIFEHNPIPWMNYLVLAYISKLVTHRSLVFEYGSGTSTLYWISKGCKVISVEHDKAFYDKLSGKIRDQCKYLLVEPVLNSDIAHRSHEIPSHYKSSDFPVHSFESYVKTIENYPDNYFDMVVVDGRARPSCLMHAKAKVKPGGILILDNSDREYYLRSTASLFHGWAQKKFRGTVRGLLTKEQTTVFHKP